MFPSAAPAPLSDRRRWTVRVTTFSIAFMFRGRRKEPASGISPARTQFRPAPATARLISTAPFSNAFHWVSRHARMEHFLHH
jgi:hypothetical protein